MNDALITPALLKVHIDAKETGEPARHAYVLGPSPAAKPLPDTAMMTPACPDDVFRVIVGVACTFARNAVSAETNNAMMRMSKVTAYRVRRNALKSKHTSLKLMR